MSTSNRRFVATFRKKVSEANNERKYITLQVGRAYESEDGNFIDLVISSIPINWDGKLRLWLDKKNEEDEEDE